MIGDRFADAMLWAFGVHLQQKRKGGDIPYIGHLLGVTSIVIEEGGSEDEAIAALLHDAVEDSPDGQDVLEKIRASWGERVAEIVSGMSDAVGDGKRKPPWRPRKEAYYKHLRESNDRSLLLVALADKLYNARSILLDLEKGEDVWARFSAPREDQLWALHEQRDIFQEKYPGALADEFALIVERIESI